MQLVGVAQKLQKMTNNTVYCLCKNVGYLCYSPHQRNNATLAYFPAFLSLKFSGMTAADVFQLVMACKFFCSLTNASQLATA